MKRSIMQVGVWIKVFIRFATGRDDFRVDFSEHRIGFKRVLERNQVGVSNEIFIQDSHDLQFPIGSL